MKRVSCDILKMGMGALMFAFFVLCTSCVSESYIESVSDLPLKTTVLPNMNWQMSSMRANAQYALYGANSGKEQKNRLGDYYFVQWYDATPKLPTRIEMLYTQAGSASKILSRSINFTIPRSYPSSRKVLFDFNGSQRAKLGDVLSWQVKLYVNEKEVDSKRSYLWR